MRSIMLPMTLGDPNHLKPPQFLHFALQCASL